MIASANRSKWLRCTLIGLLASCLLLSGLAVYAGLDLASPQRRQLQDYHREILSHQAQHGLQVVPFTLADGTPCLICSPDSHGQPSPNGIRLREQLAKRGIRLSPYGTTHAALVLCHGRNGRKEDYLPIAERFCAVGFRCILPDMPAHGDHPSDLAYYGDHEMKLPSTALEKCAQAFHFPTQPCGLIGMSMGGSIAFHAAAQDNAPWSALAIISSFDQLENVVRHQAARRFTPVLAPLLYPVVDATYRWKTGSSISAIAPNRCARRVHMPTLIAHGSNDRVIPMTLGKHNFQTLPPDTEKRWVEVPGADHDNVLITDYPIYADIAEWMLRHVK